MADHERYENTVFYGNKGKWFNRVAPILFDKRTKGMFLDYKPINGTTLLKKFNNAVMYIKHRYFTPGVHSNDPTGLFDDGVPPKYMTLMTKYFEMMKPIEEVSTKSKLARNQKKAIENYLLQPIGQLGDTNTTQQHQQNELTREKIDGKVKKYIDESISTGSTAVASTNSFNNAQTNFNIDSLTSSSSMSRRKKTIKSF